MDPIKAKHLPNYTKEDYQNWEGKWEVIKGIPFAMSPSPVRRHQSIVSKLILSLSLEIENSKCKCEVLPELDLHLSHNTIIRPDVMILCDEGKDNCPTHALLIIEILSPATRLKDLNTKFELYQEHKIPYYLIIDPDTQKQTLYKLTDNTYSEIDSANPIDLKDCSLILPLGKIF